jgi:hypothetical protein
MSTAQRVSRGFQTAAKILALVPLLIGVSYAADKIG